MEAELILDALLEPAIIVRQDGEVVAVNEAWLGASITAAIEAQCEALNVASNRPFDRVQPVDYVASRDHYSGVHMDRLFHCQKTLRKGISSVLNEQNSFFTDVIVLETERGLEYFDIQITPIVHREKGPEVWGALVLFVNVTTHKRREEELIQMAYFDYLTGLYNRRKLRLVLEETLAEASLHGDRFAVLLLDLDNFKWINDSYGHDVGDQALIEFAHRLLGCRREGVIVGRLSGDEFFVVMQKVDGEDQVHAFIEQIQNALITPLHIPDSGTRIHINLSAGFAIYPENGTSVEELYKFADVSMYHEKPKFIH